MKCRTLQAERLKHTPQDRILPPAYRTNTHRFLICTETDLMSRYSYIFI